jgi:hypothetical protein
LGKPIVILKGYYQSSRRNHLIFCQLPIIQAKLLEYISQLLKKVEVQSLPEPSQPLKRCLKCLAFGEMKDRLNQIDTAAKGTCEWLLGHEAYASWATCDRTLLWIKGKPGSGKSTLLEYALKNVMKMPGIGDRTLVLSFFFHGRGSELQRTPDGLFRSLLHQVLRAVPDALPDLIDKFLEQKDEEWRWGPNEVERLFESSLPKVLESRSVWLFVDALDECGEENAVKLVDKFKSVLQGLPSTGSQFRICFSCRHYPILDLDYGLEICLEHENKQDISTYVQARLPAQTSSMVTSQTSFTVPARIPAAIIGRADGVFMWARLVIDRVLHLVRKGKGWKDIEAELQVIPPDLDELYKNLVQDMDEKPVSLKLIQWICFAIWPLSLNELRFAMIVDADCRHKSLRQCQAVEDYANDDHIMERRLKTLSCGLVEAVPSSGSMTVQFIHQSVKDFFIEKGLSALEGSQDVAKAETKDHLEGIAHYKLSRTCIRYLAMDEIAQSKIDDRADLMSAFPLLDYATRSWVAHVKQSEARKISQDDLLSYFAWPSEALLQLWTRVYRIIERYSRDCPENETRMVHIVSRYQLMGSLRMILQMADQVGTNIDAKDHTGRTPLSWAAGSGHEAVVKLLVERDDVEADSRDNNGQTPLSWAARRGREAIVKLLVERDDVEADSRDNNGRTPLWYAADRGHEAVVTLLWYAADRGHEAVVTLLQT